MTLRTMLDTFRARYVDGTAIDRLREAVEKVGMYDQPMDGMLTEAQTVALFVAAGWVNLTAPPDEGGA